MKKHYSFIGIVLFLLLASTKAGHAQQTGLNEAADKIKAIQIQYLANKLDLSPDEAQKFWPVYNNYTHEVEQLFAERRQIKAQENLNSANADDAARIIMDKDLNYEKKMLDIRSRYAIEFQRVLPGRKAGMVFKSEREFRNIMINHLNMQRMNRMRQGGGLKRRP